MKNKINYLEKIPLISEQIQWFVEKEKVVILVKNEGVFNRICQKVFKKPKISKIYLDEIGTTVWEKIDGKKTVDEIGKEIFEKLGNKVQPLYPRLLKYLIVLNEQGFVYIK